MAASPKAAEAAQALFSAIVDYQGKKINPIPKNYRSFKKIYEPIMKRVRRKVVTPGVTLDAIDSFLTEDQDWYNSSVNIANKLFDDTERLVSKTHAKIKPKGIDLFYVRDDRNIFESLKDLWRYTNDRVTERNAQPDTTKKDLKFNNLNKWSPADIYLASKDGQRILKRLASGARLSTPFKLGKSKIYSRDSFVSFSVLNAVVKKLIDEGDLLPLSLKKAPDKQNVIIKTINYIENDVSKVLKEQAIGYHGYLYSKGSDIFTSKDIYIKFTNRPKIMMQFRDKAGTGGGLNIKYSYQGLITGGTQALDGGLGGGSIGDTLGTVNSAAGTFFSERHIASIQEKAVTISEKMDDDIEDAIKDSMCDALYNYIVKFKGKNYSNTFNDKSDLFNQLYDNKNFNIGAKGITTPALAVRARAQFIYSKFLGGNMIDFFEANSTEANEMVTNMVLYAGSRTLSSSPHFKAADISSF